MSTKYGTIITNQGAARIAQCILSGEKVKITHAAAGDGGGAYYQPTPAQTALVNEKWRGEIAGADISPTVENMMDVRVVMGADVGGFIIREMALFSEDGVAIAICNTPETEKVAISEGVSGKLTMLMHIIVADASVVEFSLTPSLDTVSREEMQAAMAEQTDPKGSAAAVETKLNTHATDADLHITAAERQGWDAGAQIALDASNQASTLEGRVERLEDGLYNNITGNPFLLTFGDLEGVVLTKGVWNKQRQRVEC